MACRNCNWQGYSMKTSRIRGFEHVQLSQCPKCNDIKRYTRAVIDRYGGKAELGEPADVIPFKPKDAAGAPSLANAEPGLSRIKRYMNAMLSAPERRRFEQMFLGLIKST